MKVIIQQMPNYFNSFIKAAEITSGKKMVKISNDNIIKILDAEHSLAETLIFEITLIDIPTFVSTHLVRHRVGVTHFVSSNRNAKFEVTRNTLVNHMMIINFQALRNMAKKRLCGRASKETREVMQAIKEEISNINPLMKRISELLQPMCEYRGGKCPELKPCK